MHMWVWLGDFEQRKYTVGKLTLLARLTEVVKMETDLRNGKSVHKVAEKKTGIDHWALLVVFVSLLVDLLGFTVILPLMPSLLEYYDRHDQVIAS